ncbi:hypothetical protein AZE42_02259 [Rhizopogon vesiculosus]|uniref:Cytochrome P450 n=1 Tax=Rhizopogon vesiculosus TaxID=180088 RepID=A0A1J8QFI6_9AGAM|nr:hypothetical protein AZE42_02259 [Rhizopogon vesiculosus]
MSLILVCLLGALSFALCKLLVFLLRRPHGIDLDGPNKGNWLIGNITELFEGGVDYCVHIAEKYGGAVRLHGPDGETIYVSDPLALYHIVVKDQHIFVDSNKLVFGEGLISTTGEQHHRQRKLLNPFFSTSNMRRLLTIVHPIADILTSSLVAEVPTNGLHKEIDMLPWLSRCAFDGVWQGVLGYHSNTLSTAENDSYTGDVGHELMKDVRDLRRIAEAMDRGSRKALAKKKAAFGLDDTMHSADSVSGEGDKKPSSQVKDIMDIMLKAKSMSSDPEWLTDSELLGQMNVMVFAGLDTTTSALTRCVYLLAQHPSAQARVRSEIRDAIKSSAHEEHIDVLSAELPYDVLMNLPFLDGVVKETLRMYPSLPLMARRATKATTLPLHFPTRSRSGADTSTVVLPKGTCIVISILAANRHRGMWDVDVPFDEDDTAPAPKSSAPLPSIKDGMRYPGVYSNMMTFLGGSRSCIGFKFAEMEIIIASLMLRLHVALPTEPNAEGHVKEIQWKLGGSHIPVVKPPAGDGVTPQVPLNVRLVTEEDFVR